MCILNTEGCNILENLSEKEYTECLDLIRDNILATDMADHLRFEQNRTVNRLWQTDSGHVFLYLELCQKWSQ